MKPGTKEQAAIYRLDRTEVYDHWRNEKLSNAATKAKDLLVELKDMNAPTKAEHAELLAHCVNNNMVIYACNTPDKDDSTIRTSAHTLNGHLGLHRLESHRSMGADGLVAIEVVDKDAKSRAGFIPYSNKPLSWHTDGYYNPTAVRIKAMTLHCVRPAPNGGFNALFDPELAYIRLRDENPDYISALSHRRTLTIPAFTNDDGETRAQSVGPVFTWDRYTGNLHMRFTDRKRHIEWADNDLTREAIGFLREVLETDEHVLTYRLEAGQGLICNNVLHNRSAFTDSEQPAETRLLLRGRYLDRIDGTC